MLSVCIIFFLFRAGEKTGEFSENCFCEGHDVICDACLNHVQTFEAISQILDQMENKWLSHKFRLASNDILQLKMHLLRAVHQDQAKIDVIDQLSEKRALIIFDFAMKFLPVKYREAQVDFFGKKGIKKLTCSTLILQAMFGRKFLKQGFRHPPGALT